MVIEPSVRVYTTWTPALIRAAEISADLGNLRQIANLCDWLLGDDRVASTLRQRVQALLGLDPTFENSGDKRRSRRVVRALEADEDWWEAYPESELSQLHTWGLLLGAAPAHHNPKVSEDHDGRVLPMPEFWHPQNLRFAWDSREWKIKTQQKGSLTTGSEDTLTPGDGKWLLHTPYGKNRPWSLGLHRGLSRLVLLKWYALGDYGRLGESGARNTVTADKEVKSSKDLRQEIANDLSQMGRDGTIVLPPGFDYKLVELAAGTKEIYDKQIELANTSIAIAIRGGNLTTEVKEGSFAATKTQAQFGDAVNLRFDAQSLTTTIHDQSLVWWAEWNFGDPNLAPWPVYPVKPRKDLKAKADTMAIAVTAAQGLQTLGFDLKRKEFAEEFELSDFVEVSKTPPAKLPIPGQKPPPNGKEPQTPPDGADGDEDPEERSDDDSEDGEENALQNVRTRRHRAASDDNGQAYTDDLAENATAKAAKELAPTVAAMIAAVRNAGSFDEAKKAIRAKYEGLASPAQLAAWTDAAMTMSQMGGHLAVREDIPELED